MANKRKRGVFFREPRKKIERKTARTIWATNAWNFLEDVEKKITRQSSSGYRLSLPWNSSKINGAGGNIDNSLEKIHENNNQHDFDPRNKRTKKFQSSRHTSLPIPVTTTPAPLAKKPSFITPIIMKRRGSLFRRASTTTLNQTQHEVDTATNIGEIVRQKVGDSYSSELTKINSNGQINHSNSNGNNDASNHLVEKGEEENRQINSSPTFVREFEEHKK